MAKITDEERALLTEEELAGMEEGEDYDEGEGTPAAEAKTDAEAAKTAAADEPVKPGEEPIVINDDGAKADEPAGATTEAAKPDAAPAAATEAAKQDEPAAKPATPAVRRGMTLPDDFDDQVAAIATSKDELIAKFDEGDIDVREYQKSLDDLNRKERELERVKDRVEYDQRTRQDHWVNVDVAGFMKDHAEYANNEVLWGLLNTEVMTLQSGEFAGNEFDPQILVKAHAKIAAALPKAFGETPAQVPATPTTPAAKKTVPNLSSMPAANVDQPGDGKFDWLDRLFETDQVKAEQELAKLSEAEQNEYLA